MNFLLVQDYALCVDGRPVGVVEAKRSEAGQSITDVEVQSGRYARFWILYHFGGIYFDTDVEVIKPIDDIVLKGALFL